MSRLGDVRNLGPGGESFPLILDDPLAELEPALKAPLLELLSRSSVDQQIVYLTEDEDVASWARLEALTGDLLVLEPTPDAAPVASSNASHLQVVA